MSDKIEPFPRVVDPHGDLFYSLTRRPHTMPPWYLDGPPDASGRLARVEPPMPGYVLMACRSEVVDAIRHGQLDWDAMRNPPVFSPWGDV